MAADIWTNDDLDDDDDVGLPYNNRHRVVKRIEWSLGDRLTDSNMKAKPWHFPAGLPFTGHWYFPKENLNCP